MANQTELLCHSVDQGQFPETLSESSSNEDVVDRNPEEDREKARLLGRLIVRLNNRAWKVFLEDRQRFLPF